MTRCFAVGCDRAPARVYLVWIGGERVRVPCCPRHEAEHRVHESIDALEFPAPSPLTIEGGTYG